MHKNIIINEFHEYKYVYRATGTLFKLTYNKIHTIKYLVV